MRVDLKVPFKDKDEAKKLGAKWDSEKKTWYTFLDSKIEIFFNWLEDIGTDHDDISADYFYIAESERKCWDCKKRTKIFTFLLEKYKKVEAAEEEELNENYKTFWVFNDIPAFTSNLKAINEAPQLAMLKHTKNYKISGSGYFANHCEHCNALQGDNYLHDEPGYSFSPTNSKELSNIKIYKVDEPFKAKGEIWPPNFLDYMDINKMSIQKEKKSRAFWKK